MLIVLTIGVAGCGERHPAVRRCVDETGALTANRNCQMPAQAGAVHHYAWVYAPAGE